MAKKDITVIIPIHDFNEEINKMLVNALESIPEGLNIIISASSNIQTPLIEALKVKEDIKYTFIDNDTSFANLVNIGVKEVDTTYFSILEFDDEYTPIWLNNVEKYLNYKPELSILMCLEDLIDFEQNKFIGNGNEAPWASSFSNELGVIDLDCLQNFFDFYLTGAVFNTEDFINNGGLKPLIKVTFWYEYLLRATSNGNQVYVMPKVGYNHYLGRKNSLIDTYKTTIDEKEQEFWFDLAKKDYHFKTQKDASYYVFSSEKEEVSTER